MIAVQQPVPPVHGHPHPDRPGERTGPATVRTPLIAGAVVGVTFGLDGNAPVRQRYVDLQPDPVRGRDPSRRPFRTVATSLEVPRDIILEDGFDPEVLETVAQVQKGGPARRSSDIGRPIPDGGRSCQTTLHRIDQHTPGARGIDGTDGQEERRQSQRRDPIDQQDVLCLQPSSSPNRQPRHAAAPPSVVDEDRRARRRPAAQPVEPGRQLAGSGDRMGRGATRDEHLLLERRAGCRVDANPRARSAPGLPRRPTVEAVLGQVEGSSEFDVTDAVPFENGSDERRPGIHPTSLPCPAGDIRLAHARAVDN